MGSTDFEEKRRSMIVSQLRTNGVSEEWIINAMGSVLREKFVPAARASVAYTDRAVPMGAGRALNPPLATGLILTNSGAVPEDNVLLIGAGSGYTAALLSGHVSSVVAVEEDASLLADAKANLQGLSNVTLVDGALNAGSAKHAPYSLVIIDGAISELPESIISQVADGGRVVTGIADGSVTRLSLGYAHAGNVVLRAFADSEIAPLPGFARAKEFVF